MGEVDEPGEVEWQGGGLYLMMVVVMMVVMVVVYVYEMTDVTGLEHIVKCRVQ